MSARLAPAVPLVLYGMCGRCEKPERDPKSAGGRSKILVGGVTLDSILPIAALETWPPNCKFLIVESDWRAFEADVDAFGAGCSILSQDRPELLEKTNFFGRSVVHQLRYRRSTEHCSVLGDMLKIWTQACRVPKRNEKDIQNGHGNLVWFSYRQHARLTRGGSHFDFTDLEEDNRLKAVGIGCYCYGITAFAANYMLQNQVSVCVLA